MSGAGANPARGEAALAVDGRRHVLRPTFQALVAAEAELGPLFALAERAAEGRVTVAETVALFWHCLVPAEGVTRERVGDAVVALGLAGTAPVLAALIGQVLRGR